MYLIKHFFNAIHNMHRMVVSRQALMERKMGMMERRQALIKMERTMTERRQVH